MIAVIDYDMGNLKSVAKAFEHVGASVCVTRDRQKIRDASKIVLPGVGAFTECMDNLKRYDLIAAVKEQIAAGKPFLGICLGLQLLFDESEEFGPTVGLGIIKGKVKKFCGNKQQAASDERLKIPHMGWNQICRINQPTLFQGIPDGSEFYFVHSYYVQPKDTGLIATTTRYGIEFCSSIEKDNVFACQFHPEKSQKMGLKLIENFARILA